MRRTKFYIVEYDSDDKKNRKLMVRKVSGYVDRVFALNNQPIEIGIYFNNVDRCWAVHELSTGMKYTFGRIKPLAIANAKFLSTAMYNELNGNCELITKCKQLINNTKEK